MRTLILYYDDNGIHHCGCVIHDGSFDPASDEDVEWKSQLTGFIGDDESYARPFFTVHGVLDEVADYITTYDQGNNEIGKQYIQR